MTIQAYQDIPLGYGSGIGDELVSDEGYDQPLRPKITFMSNDGQTTNYTFNAFWNSNPLVITKLDAEDAVGETGVINLTLYDNGNVDENLVNWGNKVKLQIAKQDSFFNDPSSTFLIGFVKGYGKNRPETGILEHNIQVKGAKFIFGERIINFKKAAKRDPENINKPSPADQKFISNELIRSIIEDKSSYPLRGRTIKVQGGFSTGGISSKLKTFIGSVNFEMQDAASAIQHIVDIEGARWFIDYSKGTESIKAIFPTDEHSGITIKSGDRKNINDPARYSSYFKGDWGFVGNTDQTSGFANRLFSTTQIERQAFVSSFVNNGSSNLTNKAIAQKFPVLETRINNLAFLLSKTGEPESPKGRINGRLYADDSNSPTGPFLESFSIDLDQIETQPSTIFVNDLDVRIRFLETAKYAWVVLYQRSGKKGKPNTDTLNTINWHHNFDTINVTNLVSMTANGGDKDDPDLDWQFSSDADKGPTYGFSVFAEIRHIQEWSDKGSIDKYGEVDALIDTSFLEEPRMIQTYLEAIGGYSCRPKLDFNINAVTCPSNFLLRPYHIVSIEDTLAYPAPITCELQRVRYSFDADSNYALGAREAQVSPMGFYDYLDAEFKCS